MAADPKHPAWQAASPAVKAELLEYMAQQTRTTDPVLQTVTDAAKPKPQTISAKRPAVPAAMRPSHAPTAPKAAQLRAARPEEGGIDRFMGDVGSAWWDSNPREGDIEHNAMLQRPGGKLGAGLGVVTNIPSLKAGMVSVKAALAAEHALPVAGGVLSRLFKGKGVKPAGADRDALMRGVASDLGEVAPQAPRPPAPPKKKTKGTTAAAPVAESAERVVPAAGAPPAPPRPPRRGGRGEPPGSLPQEPMPEGVNPNDYLLIRKQNIPPDRAENLSRLIVETATETGNVPKTRIGHTEYIEDWKRLNPDAIQDLKPLGKYQALDQDVFGAVNARMNTLNDEATRLRSELATQRSTLTEAQYEAKKAEVIALEKLVKDDLAQLIPSRSQKGRALNALKLESAKTFDLGYWISKAQDAGGGAISEATHTELAGLSSRGRELNGLRSTLDQAVATGDPAAIDQAADQVLDATKAMRDLAKAQGKQAGKIAGREAEVAGLQEILDAGKERLKALSKERASILGRMSRGGERVSKGELRLEELRPELARIVEEEKAIREATARVVAQRAALEAKVANKAQGFAQAQADIGTLEKELDVLAEKLGIAADERSKLGKVRQSLKGKLKTAEKKLTKLEAATNELDAALTDTRRKIEKKIQEQNVTGWWETAVGVSNSALIANVVTATRNLGSNLLHLPAKEIARLPAASADWIMSLATGAPRTVAPPSLGALLRAGKASVTEGAPAALDVMVQGPSASQLSRIDQPRELNTGSKILDTLGNLGFRSAVAQDQLGRAAALRRGIEEQAWLHVANDKTLTAAEKRAKWKALRDMPTNQMVATAATDAELGAFWKEVGHKYADELTFNQSNLTSKMISASRMYRREHPEDVGGQLLGGLLDVTIRFSRVPSNVISAAAAMTPAPLVMGPAQVAVKRGSDAWKAAAKGENMGASIKGAFEIWRKGLSDTERKVLANAFGDGTTGTAYVLLGMFLYENGWITGSTPDQPGERGREKTIGRPPMSIKDPISGEWHPMGAFQPMISPLMIGADLAKSGEGKTLAQGRLRDVVSDPKSALTAAGAFGAAVSEAPMLKGISAIPETLKHPETTRAGTFAQTMAAGFVPTAVAQVSSLGIPGVAAADPYRKQPRGPLEAVKARLPGQRNEVPQALTPLGQTIPEGNRLAPIASIEPSQNRVHQEIARLGVNVTPLPRKLGPAAGLPEVELTPEQYNQFQMYYGRYALPLIQERVGKPLPPAAVKAMSPDQQADYRALLEVRQDYAQMPKADQAVLIDKILQKAREAAYKEMRRDLFAEPTPAGATP